MWNLSQIKRFFLTKKVLQNSKLITKQKNNQTDLINNKKVIYSLENYYMSTSCPFLSIIVPIYNVETYLEECLNSLINIRIISKEIILINDGSTDRSGEIAEKFASSHSCIKALSSTESGIVGST